MMRILFILLFVSFSSVYALPVGRPLEGALSCCENICDPCFCPCLNYNVGFYGDYVFNRHLETVNDKDIDTTKLFTNAAYFAVNYCDWVEAFVTLGATRLSINTSFGAFSAADPHPLFELESESAFSYSIGGRISVWQWCGVNLGFQGQYFSTSPNVKRLYIAAGAVSYPGDAFKTRYSEWQIASSLSYRYNEFFIPYVALRYAHAHWKLNNGGLFVIETNTTGHFFNLDNKKSLGYSIGLSLFPYFCERVSVTVEARFPDEKALFVLGQFHF